MQKEDMYIRLTVGQIQALASFVLQDAADTVSDEMEIIICHAEIPEQEGIAEYRGLIAYSADTPEDGLGVLQLD